MTTRHLPTDQPGAYHDPETYLYVPVIRDKTTGKPVWHAEITKYWSERAAVQHAQRKAFRRFLEANPYWYDDEEML